MCLLTSLRADPPCLALSIHPLSYCVVQVVKAVAGQLATLNTNARYLHDNLVTHAELIARTMPSPLEVDLHLALCQELSQRGGPKLSPVLKNSATLDQSCKPPLVATSATSAEQRMSHP